MWIYWSNSQNNKFPFPVEKIPIEKVKEITNKINATLGEGEMKQFVVSKWFTSAIIPNWYYYGPL